MNGIVWNSPEEKVKEWALAKKQLYQDGKLLPNGTKLRRNDIPGELNHSFMVMDNKIIAVSGKGVYLGKGDFAHAKLAEDEAGDLFALKIITKEDALSSSINESAVARDVGVAGNRVTRSSTSKVVPTKHYIAYKYLGTPLSKYIKQKPLSLDENYELAIKISRALYDLHSGKKSKTKKKYAHQDIRLDNLVIDDKGHVHFIDYGKTSVTNDPSRVDIVQLLYTLFIPLKNPGFRDNNTIFGPWLGEYAYNYAPPIHHPDKKKSFTHYQSTHIFINPDDKNADGSYSTVRYALRDLQGVYREGVLKLSDIGVHDIQFKKKDPKILMWTDFEKKTRNLIETKIREITDKEGYTISKTNRSELLFNLLNDPNIRNSASALDIAETLTLCRFQLENFQSRTKACTEEARLELIHVLNSVSSDFSALFDQLRAVTGNDRILSVLKDYLMSELLSDKDSKESFSSQLAELPEGDARLLMENIEKLVIKFDEEKKSWREQNKLATPKVPKPDPLPKIDVAPPDEESILMLKIMGNINFEALDPLIVVRWSYPEVGLVQLSSPKNRSFKILEQLKEHPRVVKIGDETFDYMTIEVKTSERIDFKNIDKKIIVASEDNIRSTRLIIPKNQANSIVRKLSAHLPYGDKILTADGNLFNYNKITADREKQLEEIIVKLTAFERKMDDFYKQKIKGSDSSKKNFSDAHHAVKEITGPLNGLINQYIYNPEETPEAFKNKVMELEQSKAITNHLKTLETYPNIKQVIVDIFLAIITLGGSLAYTKLTGNSLFKVPTDATNKWKDLKDSIEQVGSQNPNKKS